MIKPSGATRASERTEDGAAVPTRTPLDARTTVCAEMAPNKPGNKGGPASQRLKVVVRKLPPDLPAKVFWSTTAQWITREDQEQAHDGVPGAEKVLWSQYRPGKVRKRCAFAPGSRWSLSSCCSKAHTRVHA